MQCVGSSVAPSIGAVRRFHRVFIATSRGTWKRKKTKKNKERQKQKKSNQKSKNAEKQQCISRNVKNPPRPPASGRVEPTADSQSLRLLLRMLRIALLVVPARPTDCGSEPIICNPNAALEPLRAPFSRTSNLIRKNIAKSEKIEDFSLPKPT